jgi:hydroxyacylglutathione hydrolase
VRIEVVRCLLDNYAYFIEAGSGLFIVDPSDHAEIQAALRGRIPKAILCTHHHNDHTGGVAALCDAFPGLDVYGFGGDEARIPCISHRLADGDAFVLGDVGVQVLHVPGHTSGAVTYLVQAKHEPPSAFTGDTLFIGGCGRLFEGSAEQMWSSMCKLRSLADETRIYCGHDYAVKNLQFGQTLEPERASLGSRIAEYETRASHNEPSVPSTLAIERRDNPFLRADDAVLCRAIGLSDTTAPSAVFAAIRERRNRF